ncbi:MAG: SDR family oxidoreductase [Alcaligenaceae bacterium]
MDFGISGKRALVIGGSSGLGLAVCEALAAEGVNLAIFARNASRLASASAHLTQRFGVKVETVAGDITEPLEVQRLAEQLKESGGLDILILNTARPPSPMRQFLDETDDLRWSQAYQQQLNGALVVLRFITPLLLEKSSSRLVAITSATVKQPMPSHAISTVFRAGVQAALKHLANETASRGLTVNAVAPASILTAGLATHHNLAERSQAIPVKRLGTPEELAATVVFLTSRQAGFITGQTVQVDGGMTAGLV